MIKFIKKFLSIFDIILSLEERIKFLERQNLELEENIKYLTSSIDAVDARIDILAENWLKEENV
jgi:prefoldin subunit 5